jgi:predicted Zn-dependent protease
MPTAPSRRALWLGSGVAALAATSLGLGWWLGQLHSQHQGDGNGKRPALERDVDQLKARLNQDEASPAEQQRLLELLVGLGRSPEAIPVLERLADQDPQRWQLRLLLAEVLQRSGQIAKADAQLQTLAGLFPNDPRALLARALLQKERGDLAGAQQALAQARSGQSEPAVQEQIDRVAAAWSLETLKGPESGPNPASEAGAGGQSP